MTDIQELTKYVNDEIRALFTVATTNAELSLSCDERGHIYEMSISGHIGKDAKWEYDNDNYRDIEGTMDCSEDFDVHIEELKPMSTDELMKFIKWTICNKVWDIQRQYETH